MRIEVVVQDEILQFKQMPNFKDGTYTVEIKNMENRSNQQSRSLYLWMTMISNTLNKHNITTTQVLRPETVWTPDKIKYMIVRPLMESLFKIKSTTKLKKGDFDLLIDTLTKAMGMKNIEIPPFPTLQEKERKGKERIYYE